MINIGPGDPMKITDRTQIGVLMETEGHARFTEDGLSVFQMRMWRMKFNGPSGFIVIRVLVKIHQLISIWLAMLPDSPLRWLFSKN